MTLTSKVLRQVKKNSNSSVGAIARRAGVDVQIARTVLTVLADLGQVELSTKQTGKRGRPAHMYKRVA